SRLGAGGVNAKGRIRRSELSGVDAGVVDLDPVRIGGRAEVAVGRLHGAVDLHRSVPVDKKGVPLSVAYADAAWAGNPPVVGGDDGAIDRGLVKEDASGLVVDDVPFGLFAVDVKLHRSEKHRAFRKVKIGRLPV